MINHHIDQSVELHTIIFLKLETNNKGGSRYSGMSICINGGTNFESCTRLADMDLDEIPKDKCLNPDAVNACTARCTCRCTRCEACKKLGKTCD